MKSGDQWKLALLCCLAGCALLFSVAAGAGEQQRIVVTLDLPSVNDSFLSPSGRMNYLPLSPLERQRQLARQAVSFGDRFQMEVEDSWPIRLLGVNCIVYRLPHGSAPREVMRRLEAVDGVDAVQELQEFSAAIDASGSEGVPAVDFSAALARLAGRATGAGVRLAVIDTGADLEHGAIRSARIDTRDLVEDLPPGAVLPPEFHGTAVVGLVLARGDGEMSMSGSAPDVEATLMRACWETSAESGEARCNTFTLAKALVLAYEAGHDILNLSISGPRDPLLERLGGKLVEDGRIVIAAGNDRKGFPGSIDNSLLAADFIDPAEPALTLVPGGGMAYREGSSIAAARLAGLASLAKELDPALGAAELSRLLQQLTAQDDADVNFPADD